MLDIKIGTSFFIHICSIEHITLASKIISFQVQKGMGLSTARATDYSNSEVDDRSLPELTGLCDIHLMSSLHLLPASSTVSSPLSLDNRIIGRVFER